jgi:L-fuconolactonase
MPEEWIQLTSEDAIDPELPICDAHHHLWYETENGYSLEDYLGDISGGHRVVQTVFVESGKMLSPDKSPDTQPVGETEYIQNIVSQSCSQKAVKTQVAAGIVGFADLTLGSKVEPVLEAHIQAGKGNFRGIRQTSAYDSSPAVKSHQDIPEGLLSNTKFQEGLGCLKKYNLSFDAWLYYHQLHELADLARKFPDVIIIVDHAGGLLGVGPYKERQKEVYLEWHKWISILANFKNVYLKLGGMGMFNCGFGWDIRTTPPGSDELSKVTSPYFLWCIEQFGVERCMFESNFPVDKRSYSYTVLWNAFKKITQDFSVPERQALFHNTAAKVYRLPVI